MTDTEWTRYAFTLHGEGEANSVNSSRSVPCQVTIASDGFVAIELDTMPHLRGAPTCLTVRQLLELSSKVDELRARHKA